MLLIIFFGTLSVSYTNVLLTFRALISVVLKSNLRVLHGFLKILMMTVQDDEEEDADAGQNAWLHIRVLRSHPGVGLRAARYVRLAARGGRLQQRREALPQTCRGAS